MKQFNCQFYQSNRNAINHRTKVIKITLHSQFSVNVLMRKLYVKNQAEKILSLSFFTLFFFGTQPLIINPVFWSGMKKRTTVKPRI